MKLFGHDMTRRELEACTGRIEQVAGIRRSTLTDGRQRGVRTADVRNGGGLAFTVLLDRGLDIGTCEFNGIPLAYLTPGQFSHPAFFHGAGTDWLRQWGGGLLTGCGLRNVGPGGPDGDDALPIHGRLSNTPATDVKTETCWTGDRCALVVEGTLAEQRMFGENLVLTRRIESEVGSSALTVTDTVRNAGFRDEPCFVLYHTNWGFPMVNADSRLEADIRKTEPRDRAADEGSEDCLRCQPPTADYTEKVYYHEMVAERGGQARVCLLSPRAGLRATIRWRLAELPHLVHWKMMGQGAYVVGLEPSNCRVDGRGNELAAGPHCRLQPGEQRQFTLRIAVEELAG